jgi:hypothetical protein
MSINLARRLKDIPESVIVLAYTDHMPCTSGHKTHTNSSNDNDNSNNTTTMVLFGGALVASLLKLITIGLVQITALPEFAQVYYLYTIYILYINYHYYDYRLY